MHVNARLCLLAIFLWTAPSGSRAGECNSGCSSSFEQLADRATYLIDAHDRILMAPVVDSESPLFSGLSDDFDLMAGEVRGFPGYREDLCVDSGYADLLDSYGCAGVVVLEAIRLKAKKGTVESYVRALAAWRGDVMFYPAKEACMNENRSYSEPVEIFSDTMYRRAWFNSSCDPRRFYIRDRGWVLPKEVACSTFRASSTISESAKMLLGQCRTLP